MYINYTDKITTTIKDLIITALKKDYKSLEQEREIKFLTGKNIYESVLFLGKSKDNSLNFDKAYKNASEMHFRNIKSQIDTLNCFQIIIKKVKNIENSHNKIEPINQIIAHITKEYDINEHNAKNNYREELKKYSHILSTQEYYAYILDSNNINKILELFAAELCLRKKIIFIDMLYRTKKLDKVEKEKILIIKSLKLVITELIIELIQEKLSLDMEISDMYNRNYYIDENNSIAKAILEKNIYIALQCKSVAVLTMQTLKSLHNILSKKDMEEIIKDTENILTKILRKIKIEAFSKKYTDSIIAMYLVGGYAINHIMRNLYKRINNLKTTAVSTQTTVNTQLEETIHTANDHTIDSSELLSENSHNKGVITFKKRRYSEVDSSEVNSSETKKKKLLVQPTTSSLASNNITFN